MSYTTVSEPSTAVGVTPEQCSSTGAMVHPKSGNRPVEWLDRWSSGPPAWGGGKLMRVSVFSTGIAIVHQLKPQTGADSA